MDKKEAIESLVNDLRMIRAAFVASDEELERAAGMPYTGNCPECAPSKDWDSVCANE